ncbi:hypothetical protein NKH77_47265 [Streptomyces sp. M19]
MGVPERHRPGRRRRRTDPEPAAGAHLDTGHPHLPRRQLPTWSLGCEVFFYALFPLLLPLCRRVPGRALWPAAGLVAVVIAGSPGLAAAAGHSDVPPPVSESFPGSGSSTASRPPGPWSSCSAS